jgi:hypothetical protein
LILKPGEYGKIRKRGIDSLKEVLRKAHPVFVEFAKQIQDFSQFHPLKGNRAYVKDWAKDGILLIGDAAHTCSPAGGIGVSIAVETTAVAVEVIKEAFEKNDFSHAQLSQLQRHRKKDVKLVHFLQSRARFILNSPRIFRKAAPLAVRIIQFLGFLPVFARRILVQPSNFRVSHKRPRYPADLKLGKALELYFKRSGFCRETYTEKWIKLPAGPIFFYLPNITPRKDVVPLHDIDHVLTEYETDWPGEMQITGYELATGLGRYWFGWVINFQGLWLGLTLFPKKFIEGFLRGRRSGCVYRLYEYNDALLEKTVGEIRDQVKVAPRTGHKMEFSDVLALGGVCIASILIHIPFIVGAAAAVYGLIWN